MIASSVRAAQEKALAREIEADGFRKAEIKKADGEKTAKILRAEGESKSTILIATANAEKIQKENEALNKYFTKNAQVYEKLETVKTALKDNTKFILPEGQQLINVIGNAAGILPIKTKGGD